MTPAEGFGAGDSSADRRAVAAIRFPPFAVKRVFREGRAGEDAGAVLICLAPFAIRGEFRYKTDSTSVHFCERE